MSKYDEYAKLEDGDYEKSNMTVTIPTNYPEDSYVGYGHTNRQTDQGVFYAGMLTGSQIYEEVDRGRIKITPFDKAKINPNSYNLTLNNTLLVYDEDVIDFKKKNKTKKVIIPDSGLVLKPNVLYIGRTNEECYSDTFIPMLNGRSSIGRLGICVHVTAGFGDIGWKGTWTLEIIAFKPVKIYPNIEFCQVSYFTPFGQTYLQYDGRYQGQIEPTASKSSLEKKVYL